MNLTQKISQMTPKGANLEGTDLLEVSTLESGSYVTRSITGQDIIDAAAGSGVTDITTNAPLATTGGTTPDLSISEADGTTDGYLTAVDWSTFNGKQAALVSGTNIKTINSTSVLGSGNIAVQAPLTLTTTGTSGAATLVGSTLNVPQYSGGVAVGVHAPLVVSGRSVSYMITSALSLPTAALSNQRISAMPFIPMVGFTSASFYINVSTLQAGALARILIYSNLNGLPDQKLYESANLDLSTNGIKTAVASFSFNAGTTYWLALHSQGTAQITFLSATNMILIAHGGVSAPTTYFYPTVAYPIGSAPTTFGAVNSANGNAPFIAITAA
jgi:hypothetical protein